MSPKPIEKFFNLLFFRHFVSLLPTNSHLRRRIEVLSSTSNLAVLISERVLNIPPEISVPLYETLFNEVKKAVAKEQTEFENTHYILISR